MQVKPTVVIMCRRKARGNSSWHLEQQLLERGVSTYRATPRRYPLADVSEAQLVVNYGCSTAPVWIDRMPEQVQWLNGTATVMLSANKLMTVQALNQLGVPTLEYTTDREEAQSWIDSNRLIVSRTTLNGSRGSGIVLSPPDPLPDAPLYTRLVRGGSVREYRAYVVDGECIDIAQKRRWRGERLEQAGIDRRDPYTRLIRTNGNGWVFARNSIDANERVLNEVKMLANKTAEGLLLGFGVVDIIVKTGDNEELLEARVVEPNTAPSLVGDRNTRALMGDAVANLIRRRA